MKQWLEANYEQILTVLIIIMMCITRSSMALGNIVYGFIILLTIVLWVWIRPNVHMSTKVKSYALMYGIMLLFLLPSPLCSENISKSLKYFANIYIWKTLIVIPILLFIRSKSKLYALMVSFFVYMGVDSLIAFGQYILDIDLVAGRSGGAYRGSVMGLAMLLTFAFPLAIISIFDKQMPPLVRKSAFFSAGAILLGMCANQSRASWLCNGMNSIWISIKYGVSNIKYLLIACIVITGIFVGFSQNEAYVERLYSIMNTTNNLSNLGRLDVWQADQQMISDYPITGVGPGLWQDIYREKYRLNTEVQDLGHSHNNFLQVTAESGILGLIGFLLFNIYVVYTSLRSYIKQSNPYDLSIAVGWISYIFLFGMIDYTWGNSSGIRIFWVVMTTLFMLRRMLNQ